LIRVKNESIVHSIPPNLITFCSVIELALRVHTNPLYQNRGNSLCVHN